MYEEPSIWETQHAQRENRDKVNGHFAFDVLFASILTDRCAFLLTSNVLQLCQTDHHVCHHSMHEKILYL